MTESSLRAFISDYSPLLYHCSELFNTLNEKDVDILTEGILPPNMYDGYDYNPKGDGFGGSYASIDAGKPDHICVWVKDEKTPMDTDETLGKMRDRQITFILNEDTPYEMVNDHTGEQHYHDSEGLVEGPIEVIPENIEAVVIAKEKILWNHRGDDANPSQEFMREEIEKIKEKIEKRGIPVFLTDKKPFEE